MQYVKCGFAGENFPTSVFPCVVGRPMLRYEESLMEQELKDIVVGSYDNWLALCEHFRGISEVNPETGKSKSDNCSSSRKQNQQNHGFGRTSIAAWSNKYTTKFQKEPTAGHVFDKGYLRLDAIKLGEESSTSDQNPNGLCANPELREIFEKLHKGVQERIDGGSEGSIASSETVLEIFGKSKLGVLHHKIRKEQSCSKQTKASLEKQLAASQAHIKANEAHIKALESRMAVFESYMQKRGKMPTSPSVSGSENTLEDEEDMQE